MTARKHRIALDSLRMLAQIEEYGSFTAAAKAMCVVTSSVTHAVRNLEDQLGFQIFDRSGRGMRFTDRGRELLAGGRSLLAHAEAFDEQVQLMSTGWERSLTLCLDEVLPIAPLMPMIHAFLDAAPSTSLSVRKEIGAGSWDALGSGRVDLAVGAAGAVPAGSGFESMPLFDNHFVLAVAPGHPLAHGRDNVDAEELRGHRAVVMADTARSLPRLSFWPHGQSQYLEVQGTDQKLLAIIQGIGYGFLPAHAARPLEAEGRLVILATDAEPPPGPAVVAWRSGEDGRALRWWRDELLRPGVAASLWS